MLSMYVYEPQPGMFGFDDDEVAALVAAPADAGSGELVRPMSTLHRRVAHTIAAQLQKDDPTVALSVSDGSSI